jgi:hypothetical protein
MISASKFARTYTSFWQECLFPNDKDFVRDANRSSQVYCRALTGTAERDRYGDVSEIALRLFAASVADKNLLKSKRRTAAKIREICGLDLVEIGEFGASGRKGLTIVGKKVTADALEIAERLRLFIERHHYGEPLIFTPSFPGCGFVDRGEGDILLGETLYDVKSSEETFRLNHFRQLLVYLTLNAYSRAYEIRRVGLINPRRGDYFHLEVEAFTEGISGKHSSELFSEIVAFISGGGISR